MSKHPLPGNCIAQAQAALNIGHGARRRIGDGKLHKSFVFRDVVEAFGFMTRRLSKPNV